MSGSPHDNPMSASEFLDALDLYGPALETWPADLGRRAAALIAVDPDARQAQRSALKLDAALAALPAAPPDLGFATRITARVREEAASAASQLGLGRLIAWGTTALAASLVAGFVAGSTITVSDDDSSLAALVFPAVDTTTDMGGELL